MAGTKEGGQKAAATNKERYDAQYAEHGGFYGYIGKMGAQTPNRRPGGFAVRRDLAVTAGRKGGKTPRRQD